jgi:hypothetical protein
LRQLEWGDSKRNATRSGARQKLFICSAIQCIVQNISAKFQVEEFGRHGDNGDMKRCRRGDAVLKK